MIDPRDEALTAADRTVPEAIETEVISNQLIASDISLLELRLPPQWGPPTPGQYVSITMEPPWIETESGAAGSAILRRPFGIAGYRPGSDYAVVEIIYAAVGGVTNQMAAALPGSRLGLLGPRGTAFPIITDSHVVLIGGGRGIAPLIYVGRAYAEQKLSFEILFGARDTDQLIPMGSLTEYTKSITEQGAQTQKGTVIDLLNRAKFPKPPVLMACGPEAMLNAVADWAKMHQLECWVSLEAVFGCSIGICGGCAVPAVGEGFESYLWACRQGPVVRAEQVDWQSWLGDHQ